jgi:hypothetical protein
MFSAVKNTSFMNVFFILSSPQSRWGRGGFAGLNGNDTLFQNQKSSDMKKNMIMTAVAALMLTGFSKAVAQQADPSLQALLGSYLSVKNALVAGDNATAATKAAELVSQVNAVKTTSLPAKEQAAFSPLQQKLAADAKAIADTKELEKQRVSFSALSTEMLTLSKVVKLAAAPVYEQYCPMKKASWISAEADVKNPYYGKMMLTCGKTVQTIQ